MRRWGLDSAGFLGRCPSPRTQMPWMLLVVFGGLLIFWDNGIYRDCLEEENSCVGKLLSHPVGDGFLRNREPEDNTNSLKDERKVTLQREGGIKTIYSDSPDVYKTIAVEAAVGFNDTILLLLNASFSGLNAAFHQKRGHKIKCLFAREVKTRVLVVEDEFVLCQDPLGSFPNSTVGFDVSLQIDNSFLRSSAIYGHMMWTKLVYGSVLFEGEGDLLIFVKGLSRMKRSVLPDGLECLYGNKIRTQVVSFCQENVRCKLPPPQNWQELNGKAVTVALRNQIFHSVVRFTPSHIHHSNYRVAPNESKERPHFLCVCTLVWNGAKFLKEWIMYHSYIGVQKFFIYDNNSDDEIESVLESLHYYNVSRHPWPWLKTQEASFSHCMARASNQCIWVAFIDVDEFIFPKNLSSFNKGRTMEAPLHSLIKQHDLLHNGKLGQLKVSNFNFGPSGLSTLPRSGQMVNYICRMKVPKRVKSIVRASAVDSSYCSRVHYFDLKVGYVSGNARRKDAVIHHYKWHVWQDFKLKFARRAATYVTDWGQNKDLDSFDRTPGLGTQPIEPHDWIHRFCEIKDTSLRDLITNASRLHAAGKLLWER